MSPVAAAETKLTVRAAFDGQYVPGTRVPMRVRIEADRLTKGTLRVVVSEAGAGMVAGIKVSVPVEIPGGSVKEYLLVVPTSRDGSWLPGHVELATSSGRQRAPVPTLRQTDQELVGLMPGVLQGRPVPGPAPLAVDVGVARFFALDNALLAAAPASLESVSTIGIGPDELRRLSPRLRPGLVRWIADGGRLLVDAAAGTDLQMLPASWRPGPAGRATAGHGEVVLTAGAMSAGTWTGLVEPTTRGGKTAGTNSGSGYSGGPGSRFSYGGSGSSYRSNLFFEVPVSNAVAEDMGIRFARLPWLSGFLLAYVLAAGPITFVVLRRKRRSELAWIVVPALAVLFGGAAYAGGSDLRHRREAHQTILTTGEAGTMADVTVGVTGGVGGDRTVQFARDWAPAGVWEQSGQSQIAQPEFTLTSRGPRADLDLGAGDLAIARASGPLGSADRTQAGSGLEVSGRSEADGMIRGTVRNGTGLTVRDAAVLVGKSVAKVGEMRPGETRKWEVTSQPRSDHWSLPGQDLWAGTQSNPYSPYYSRGLPTPSTSKTSVSYALWQASTSLPGGDPLDAGHVLAVGWTRDFRPEVKVDGRTLRPKGRTMILGRAPVQADAATMKPLTVAWEQVRGPGILGPEPGWDDLDPSISQMVLKFTLPADSPGKLVLRYPDTAESVEVWQGGAWQKLRLPVPTSPTPGTYPLQPRRQAQVLPPGMTPSPSPSPDPNAPTPDPNATIIPTPTAHPPPQVYGYPGPSYGQGTSGASYAVDLPHPAGRQLFVRVQQTPGQQHTGWAFSVEGAG
ncbi:MAG TPA: hypothetical protein VNE62_06185 [Actinomycetota bacterium]|nr:hypothetical protein [Actinomycetota bacterium]